MLYSSRIGVDDVGRFVFVCPAEVDFRFCVEACAFKGCHADCVEGDSRTLHDEGSAFEVVDFEDVVDECSEKVCADVYCSGESVEILAFFAADVVDDQMGVFDDGVKGVETSWVMFEMKSILWRLAFRASSRASMRDAWMRRRLSRSDESMSLVC